MKKIIILSFILINCIACSNGQNKNNTNSKQDLSTEILGCWKLVDARYEIKSNYPEIDSLLLEDCKLYITSKKENPSIIKFFKNNLILSYTLASAQPEARDSYEIKKDTLSIEDINTPRTDTRSSSKISIRYDTLYIESNVQREIKKIIRDFVSDDKINLEILDHIKIETAKRYTTFVRVADCDQYKEEEE